MHFPIATAAAQHINDLVEVFQDALLIETDQLEPEHLAFISETLQVPYVMGCARATFLFDDFVVKIPLFHDEENTIMVDEATNIHDWQKTMWRRHFPETHIVTHKGISYQIQERIAGVGSHLSYQYETTVAHLAERLGIGDMNGDNFGWKNNIPVFVDCEQSPEAWVS